MDSGTKIRIKVGLMEVEYEGDAGFLKDGLEGLLSKMADISTKVPVAPEQTAAAPSGGAPAAEFNGHDFSTSTIAAHLEAKTAAELAICALAKLQFVDGKTSADRKEILAEMKKATDYYNKNMRGNLSRALKTLTTRKRINQGANNCYSLNADERKSIGDKIADIE